MRTVVKNNKVTAADKDPICSDVFLRNPLEIIIMKHVKEIQRLYYHLSRNNISINRQLLKLNFETKIIQKSQRLKLVLYYQHLNLDHIVYKIAPCFLMYIMLVMLFWHFLVRLTLPCLRSGQVRSDQAGSDHVKSSQAKPPQKLFKELG